MEGTERGFVQKEEKHPLSLDWCSYRSDILEGLASLLVEVKR